MVAYYNYGLAGALKYEAKAFEIILECANLGHVGAMYDLGAKGKLKSKVFDSKKYLILANQNGSNRAKLAISKEDNPCIKF